MTKKRTTARSHAGEQEFVPHF